MLLNQHLYNRALIKKKNDQKRRGLDALLPKTSIAGLSINLQEELLNEKKPDEFKKVVIEDKKQSKEEKINKEDKKIIIKEEVQEEEFSHISNENLEEDDKEEIMDLESDEEFDIVDNEQDKDLEKELEEENELLEKADLSNDKDQSGGGLNNIKKVVVSFF